MSLNTSINDIQQSEESSTPLASTSTVQPTSRENEKRNPNIPVAVQVNQGTYVSSFPNENTERNQYTTTHYVETPPESYELQRCWQYGKTVKCLACIDSFFCLLNALTLWPMIFISMMPVCGYYGAKTYDKKKTIVYLVYCALLVMGRIIQLDNIYHHRYDKNPDDKVYSDSSKFLVVFSIFIQIWITWIVGKFIKFLYSLNDTQLSTLRIGTYVPVVTSVLYY